VRWIVACWLLATIGLCACKERAPSPSEIADRGWAAHEIVIAAGEHAASCADAGLAMQRAFVAHRQAFVDAIALDKNHVATVGQWEDTFTGPSGKPMTSIVRTTEVLVKQQGRWKYLVDHASVGAPPPAPARRPKARRPPRRHP